MAIKNYKSSEWSTKVYKTTSVYTSYDETQSSYDFRIKGNVNTIEEFINCYIQERIQMWRDYDYDGGIWSESVDNGYQNLLATLDSGDYTFKHINWESDFKTPASGTCCGETIELESFTNTCDKCGADYNSSGQLLASRECWGEETGEHWLDCY